MSHTLASGVDFERLLTECFRHAHWRVRRHPRLGDLHPDFFVDAIGKTYIVKLKRSSEGRGDRLIPLPAQTILRVQAIARQAAGKAPDRLFGDNRGHSNPNFSSWVKIGICVYCPRLRRLRQPHDKCASSAGTAGHFYRAVVGLGNPLDDG